MDRSIAHKAIVKALIQEIGAMSPTDDFSETHTITDDEHGHYVLFDIGWHEKRRVYLPFIHVEVKPDGKVWIQHDGTDLRIAMLLTERGIPKSAIVLGFKAPYVRAMIDDFAVA
jgi:XisI protein